MTFPDHDGGAGITARGEAAATTAAVVRAKVRRVLRLVPAAVVAGALLIAGPAASAQGNADDAMLNQFKQLLDAGDNARIVAVADRVIAAAERKFGTKSTTFVQVAILVSRSYKAQGRRDLAEPLIKRALEASEKHLGADHELTARSLDELARFHNDVGFYVEAEPLQVRALAIRERTLGREHRDTAQSLSDLGGTYYAMGRYVEAEPLQKRTLAIREKTLGADHPETAETMAILSRIYLGQGRYPDAEALGKRAVAAHEKSLGPNAAQTAFSIDCLARVYDMQGRPALAEPLYRRALAAYEKSRGAEAAETAMVLGNLAGVLEAQGNMAEAQKAYERALKVAEKTLGPRHPHTATTVNNLARLHAKQGQPALALPLYERALKAKEALGDDHPETAIAIGNLASTYEALGRYAEALPLSARALAICEKSLGPDHPHTATSLHNLAFLHHVQGQHERAMPLYERAVKIQENCLGPDHPGTTTALANLALMHAARGRWADAGSLFDRVRRGVRRHVAQVLPSLSAAEQAAFLREKDEYHLHVALVLALHERASREIAALSAGWLANAKAVGQEAASQRIILARQSNDPQTASLVKSLETVRQDLARLSQSEPDPKEARARRDKMASLLRDEQRLIRELGGQIAALDREEPWAELDAIRANVPAGSILVDIARFHDHDLSLNVRRPARYAAWIVPPAGKGDVTIVDLGEAEAIEAAVQACREAIEGVQKGGFRRGQATAEDELKVTAAPLSAKVLQPVVEAIGDATDVILSPDGSLWLVPWQALPLADGSYAIEKFSIRTVTSARDLVPAPADARRGKGGSVVVADPAFDAAPAPSGKPAGDSTRAFAPASGVERRFTRLPGTRAEVSATKPAIAKLTGSEPTMLLGADANETNFKRSAVRPKTVVLATHGFFKPDQWVKRDDKAGSQLAGLDGRGPAQAVTTTGEALEDPLLRCGLALAGANVGAKATGSDDGILTGAEIVGLDLLGTDLVVLSACETGVGKVQNGEGVAGLRQAFQIAGATSVVATLWQVPDAESAQIMQSFYANLTKGATASTALREAQLAFIKARREDRNYEAAHPYLWAAYGVTGR